MNKMIDKIKRASSIAAALTILIPSSAFALDTDEVTNLVDVSFSWTQERENNYGGRSQVLANMNGSLGITNTAHDNSGTGVQFNYIVLGSALNYNASSSNNNVITALKNGGVPGTVSRRDLKGADVMALNTQMAAAGLAFLGDPRQYAVKFLTGSASAHELGHTFGCGHGGVGSSYSSGNGETAYAGGWAYVDGNNVRRGTIMTGAQILWYSTPEKTFQGQVTGIPNVKDSTRRIRETKFESSRIRNIRPEGGRSGGWWLIRNRFSNNNVNLKQHNNANGTQLALRAGTGGYSRWRFDSAGIGGGWMNSRNQATGKAIDKGNSPNRGNFVKQWTFLNNVNQQLKLDHDDSGLVRLRFRNGNTVLANNNRQTWEGNLIVDWTWGGQSHLQWYLIRNN